jgi:hypothetical protein
MRWAILTAALLLGCDEDRLLRVTFADWDPQIQSMDLWRDGQWVARLNKATLCLARVGAWCADGVKVRLASGQTYQFEVVGTARDGRRLRSNRIAYTQP